jgi:hypothetical protein
MTEIPQRELAIRLRIAIDRAMAEPTARWLAAVARLVQENPRGVASSHVTHNLGAARRAWLARFGARPAASFVPFSSLSEDELMEWTSYLERKITALEGAMVRKNDTPQTTKSEPRPKPKDEGTPIRGDAVPTKKG